MKRGSASIGWGVILVVIGLIIILNNFEVLPFIKIVWTLVALILIWWGFNIMRRGHRHRDEAGYFASLDDKMVKTSLPRIDYSSVFGDLRVKIESNSFSNGSASNVFGMLLVDMGAVEKIEGSGQLNLHSVFGDIIVRLPDRIPFMITGCSTFGSVTTPDGSRIHGRDYKSQDFETATEKLSIHVSQVFGNVEVIQ
jgi:predicted membrane protein